MQSNGSRHLVQGDECGIGLLLLQAHSLTNSSTELDSLCIGCACWLLVGFVAPLPLPSRPSSSLCFLLAAFALFLVLAFAAADSYQTDHSKACASTREQSYP